MKVVIKISYIFTIDIKPVWPSFIIKGSTLFILLTIHPHEILYMTFSTYPGYFKILFVIFIFKINVITSFSVFVKVFLFL